MFYTLVTIRHPSWRMLLTYDIGTNTNGHLDQQYHQTWKSWVFLRAFHVRTRSAHQVTVATQYVLQHRAYDHNCKANDSNKEVWIGVESPQFQYSSIKLEMELLLNAYVCFQTSISFTMFLMPWQKWPDDFMPWTTYTMPIGFQCIWRAWQNFLEGIRRYSMSRMFREDCFKVQKTKVFSWIPIDQAHGQNNACIKGDGKAVGSMIIQLLSGAG
jgi:hypothetical protein